jgi:hypothetical protein
MPEFNTLSGECGIDTVQKCEGDRLALEAAKGRYKSAAAAEVAEFQGGPSIEPQSVGGH